MSARPVAASAEILEAADLRFGQVGIANVRVRNADPEALRASLEVRVHEAPSLFERAPVVVDLSFLSAQPADAEVAALLAERSILDLHGPVLRVTGYDVPYPYWQLEDWYMPSVERVVDAVRRVLAF